MAAGIYTIVNTKTGMVYVGRSADAEQEIATAQEQLSNGEHQNGKLQLDWENDGPDVFNFRVIERVESEDALTARQQGWIDQYLRTHGQELIYNDGTDGMRVSAAEPGLGAKIIAAGCLGLGVLLIVVVAVMLLL